MFAVGPYTMAEWKVVWREQTSFFQAAIIGTQDNKPVIPDHKLMAVACAEKDEAFYLTALLNSSPSVLAIASFIISTSTSVYVLENIRIPRFSLDNPLHMLLAHQSMRAHELTAEGNTAAVAVCEAEIDRLAARLWEITDDELTAIQAALQQVIAPDEVEAEEEDEE